MLLRPKMPDAPPVPTAHLITSALPTERPHSAAPCACGHTAAASAARPVVPYVGLGVGAVAAVLVVGVVLTALLATVAVTAVSVSIAAMVLRSLLGRARTR
ncbi:SpdD protein [Streptomyces sp. MS2.AVA.5]|uniref:SpdD protein n=1 Tax=Streptomyces achmelvichensis TaxID=3134111 RepID=A0ACC6PY83_9ACTN